MSRVPIEHTRKRFIFSSQPVCYRMRRWTTRSRSIFMRMSEIIHLEVLTLMAMIAAARTLAKVSAIRKFKTICDRDECRRRVRWLAAQQGRPNNRVPRSFCCVWVCPTIQGVAASGHILPESCWNCCGKGCHWDTRAAKKHGKVEEWVVGLYPKTENSPIRSGNVWRSGHFFGDNVTIPEGYAAVGDTTRTQVLTPQQRMDFLGLIVACQSARYARISWRYREWNIRVFNPGPYDRWLGAPGTVIGNALKINTFIRRSFKMKGSRT